MNEAAAETRTSVINVRELRDSILLRAVELESVQGLLEDATVRELKKGEVLIHAGQPNHHLYLLLSGRLRVHLKLNLDPIVILEPGEVVGELSLIDGQLTSAYVVAHQESRVLALDEKTVWSLVDSCPTIALNLLFVLAQRLRHGNTLVLTGQQIEREYERYAVIDALTGLYNRRWLDNILARHLKQCKQGGWPLSLLMIEIDDFPRYREIYGQAASDRVLYTLARTLRENMRSGQIIARSEDAFISLLPDSDGEAGRKVAERLRAAVNGTEIQTAEGKPLSPVTVSVAVANMVADDIPETLLQAARDTLIEIREGGGNRTALSVRAG